MTFRCLRLVRVDYARWSSIGIAPRQNFGALIHEPWLSLTGGEWIFRYGPSDDGTRPNESLYHLRFAIVSTKLFILPAKSEPQIRVGIL